MILLLGASGYVGQAFARNSPGAGSRSSRSRVTKRINSRFDVLLDISSNGAAGIRHQCGRLHAANRNVDACETARAGHVAGQHAAAADHRAGLRGGGRAVGTCFVGCIFSGAKVNEGGRMRVEKDLTAAGVEETGGETAGGVGGIYRGRRAEFSFRDGPCSFYSGSKALAEEAINGAGKSYVWRLRIPFDEQDNGAIT